VGISQSEADSGGALHNYTTKQKPTLEEMHITNPDSAIRNTCSYNVYGKEVISFDQDKNASFNVQITKGTMDDHSVLELSFSYYNREIG
jgi:hypothetical protein